MREHPSELGPSEEAQLRRDWTTFILLAFLFGVGFAVYNGAFANFMRDELHAQPLDFGRVESLREIPGLLTALLAGTLVVLVESRVAGLGLAVASIGIALTGVSNTLAMVTMVNVLWSVGFHVYASVTGALTLNLSRGKEGGRHLGRMSSVGALATISGLGFALLVRMLFPEAPYSFYFFTAGVLIFAASVLCWRLSPLADGAPRQPIVFRREYGLYYVLMLLEGCRRQLFTTFATFVLVAVYDTDLKWMLALHFTNAVLIAITAPFMGRLIDRVGERKPLIFYSVMLTGVFLAYAGITYAPVLYALYLLDHVLFTFNIGFTTYLNRIVRPGELTPSLAMGATVNHIPAVLVPYFGALLWTHTDRYQSVFYVAVVVALMAVFATMALPKHSARAPTAGET